MCGGESRKTLVGDPLDRAGEDRRSGRRRKIDRRLASTSSISDRFMMTGTAVAEVLADELGASV
jgi:hypothetical protein